MDLAPIASFVYNRPEHTKRTLDALSKNKLAKYSDLTIYSDAAKNSDSLNNVQAVRKVVSEIKGFKSVNLVFREENFGLTKSIIEGISDLVNEYGKVISVEDDIVTSEFFLNFINDGLEKYEKNKKVFSISGYSFPQNLLKLPQSYTEEVYFVPRVSPWGWGTWKDRWVDIDWEVSDYEDFINNKTKVKEFISLGKDRLAMLRAVKNGTLKTWDIQWDYAIFRKEAYSVYPVLSFVDNIGLDGSGEHTGPNNWLRNFNLNSKEHVSFPNDVIIEPTILEAFRKCNEMSFIDKVVRYVQKMKKRLFKRK